MAGEVHSDEEEEEEEGGEGRGGGGGVPGSRGSGLSPAELVPLVAGLVALMPGREAARALRCLMQLHTNMKQCVRHQGGCERVCVRACVCVLTQSCTFEKQTGLISPP